jgi:hypothetical protein
MGLLVLGLIQTVQTLVLLAMVGLQTAQIPNSPFHALGLWNPASHPFLGWHTAQRFLGDNVTLDGPTHASDLQLVPTHTISSALDLETATRMLAIRALTDELLGLNPADTVTFAPFADPLYNKVFVLLMKACAVVLTGTSCYNFATLKGSWIRHVWGLTAVIAFGAALYI